MPEEMSTNTMIFGIQNSKVVMVNRIEETEKRNHFLVNKNLHIRTWSRSPVVEYTLHVLAFGSVLNIDTLGPLIQTNKLNATGMF